MVLCVEVNGFIDENCYFYTDKRARGFIIDPGAQAGRLLGIIKERNLIIERILLTHSHFDHIGAVSELAKALGVQVYAHHNAREYLQDPSLNLSNFTPQNIIIENFIPLSHGDKIVSNDGELELAVLHTPGHTTDSVCFYSACDGLVFSGDTIFRGTVGNHTFPGGDYSALMASIERKIFTLPDETILYPGHGEPTTVSAEKF